MSITILLVDDHEVLRQSVRQFLNSRPDLAVVAEASSGLQAIQLARDLHPDVAIVDVKMPGMNGIEATSRIVRDSPHTGVLILSIYGDERYVQGAVKAGAIGYLLKDSIEDELIPAIESASQGKPYFSPAVNTQLKGRQDLPS
jgi:DNA-binding NarL/FixJ family response regulator